MKTLKISYPVFKQTKTGQGYYCADDTSRTLMCFADEYVMICPLYDSDDIVDFDATLRAGFTEATEDEATALALAAANRNRMTAHLSDGKPIVSLWPTEGSRVTAITPDWSKPCTWVGKAVRVVDETATCSNPGTYTQYAVAHQNVIDSYHGRISGEDTLRDASGNSYRVVVTVDGTAKVEQDPHFGTGGDFTINYSTGIVTFLSALTADAAVTLTYHYANGSEFTLRPAPGKSLKIKSAEVQFCADTVMNDTVSFQPYGLVDVFAPQLMPGIPSGTKIPLGAPTKYKSILDLLSESNGAYPVIPALSGGTWRGLGQSVVVMPWTYISLLNLSGSAGMEIRVKLEHDQEMGGSGATVTFYAFSVDE